MGDTGICCFSELSFKYIVSLSQPSALNHLDLLDMASYVLEEPFLINHNTLSQTIRNGRTNELTNQQTNFMFYSSYSRNTLLTLIVLLCYQIFSFSFWLILL